MVDSIDDEYAAMVATPPALPSELPGPDCPGPDNPEHPVYTGLVPAAARLIQLLDLPPAARPTGEIALFDPCLLSPAARIDLLILLEEQKHWLDSVQQRVLAEIEAADASELHLSQEAVSLALRVPTRTAQAKLKTAGLLVRELPATLSLLQTGKISSRHTEVICEQAWSLSPKLVADFEGMALARAADQTVGQLRQAARRAAARIDPDNAERRHQHAVTGRKVGFQPCEDGMVLLPVLLDAPQGQLIFTRLTAAATLLLSADDRTMDQKRADLLVDAVLSGLPHDSLPELQGRRPSIQIVVSADTLLGLDDEPADLAGYGPITAETARRYAADRSGTWRRLLTDPDSGALLDIGKDSYRPAQRLRDFVLARDSVCCFPTCGQPGYRCEFEHIVAFAQGGRTCRCGGALACKRHNLCKIGTGWQYRRLPDGSYRWTDDTGHSYTGHPPQRWVPNATIATTSSRASLGSTVVSPRSTSTVTARPGPRPNLPAPWGRTISDVSSLPALHRASPQDSCPGAVRLHQAADGGLARVRVPGGVLTAAQWQALIAAARELGNGQLELTSRGNLQVRGLRMGDEASLAARLQEVGLLPSPAHERVRNLLASPLTGRDGAGLSDIRPLIAEFDRALCARPTLAELSGRFLFTLDDGRADVLAGDADIAVIATSPAQMQLVLAGQSVGAPVPSAAAVELMLDAAEAFLVERQAQDSNAWRLAELADGPARVAARLVSRDVLGTAGAGTAHPAALTSAVGRILEPGPLRQRDGASALVIGVPLGSLSADQGGALLAPQLILTPWRSVVLADLAAGESAELLATCSRLGMITDGSDPLYKVTACTGRPGCASALADVRAEAITVHRASAPAAGVHWSGCARRCGRPAGTVTDVIATGSGYWVSRGGRGVEVGSTPAELSAALRTDPVPAGAIPAGAR